MQMQHAWTAMGALAQGTQLESENPKAQYLLCEGYIEKMASGFQVTRKGWEWLQQNTSAEYQQNLTIPEEFMLAQ